MVDASPNRATMLVLAYLWPLAIVPLLMSKDDTEVQWHARHGLILMAAELIAVLVLSVLAGVMTMMAFGLGLAFGVLTFVLLWATILIVHVLAMIKALGGSRLEVPAISRYASRF
jgi:uncharacterized membrane protein